MACIEVHVVLVGKYSSPRVSKCGLCGATESSPFPVGTPYGTVDLENVSQELFALGVDGLSTLLSKQRREVIAAASAPRYSRAVSFPNYPVETRMTDEPTPTLDDLADQVAEEFEAHRDPNEIKDVSLVVDDSDRDRPTLIVHVDREDADSLADQIETFLSQQGAHTKRERHSETDVRVLATI